MPDVQLFSLIENSVSLAILGYFVMYFKGRTETITDRYMLHLEQHKESPTSEKKDVPDTQQ